MRIETGRWGTVDVSHDHVYAFPDGLVGFPDLTRIAVLPDGAPDARWLQSVEDPKLAFSAIVPWQRFPEYEPVLPLDDQLALALETEEDAMVLCLLAGDGEAGSTANLLGPLVLNQRTRRGRQVVLFDSGWPLRAAVAA